jgi:hypothetical protein
VKEIAKLALISGGLKKPAESQIEILSIIITKYVDQQLKGLKKYDVAINPLDDYDWLDMKLEEQIDGAVYSICETLKTKKIRDDLMGGANEKE